MFPNKKEWMARKLGTNWKELNQVMKVAPARAYALNDTNKQPNRSTRMLTFEKNITFDQDR